MPIEQSEGPIKSRRSSVAGSQNTIRASYRPRSKTCTSPTRSFAATTAMDLLSSTFATTCCCEQNPPAITSMTTASTKPSRTSPLCASASQKSPITTSTCNRTSWTPSSTAVSFASSQNLPLVQPGGAFLDSKSTIPDFSPSCTPFALIAAFSTFTTAEIYPHVIKALGRAPEQFPLASLR